MADRKLRVFLCHASQDKPAVRDLYQRLLAEGWIDPWLDEEKLLPGHDWDMEIEKAVESADVVIVCLSNRSVTKEGYIQRELRFALDIALQKPEGTIFIIPLKLEDCEPPRRLRTWQYVEYFPSNKREKSFRLMKISMQERWNSLGLAVNDSSAEFADPKESLSSRIISKKLSDARQALQNDQLLIALGIYEALAKQSLRLHEIIHDLEDVSIVYSDSRELWMVLATAYRMNGDIQRAQETEEKIYPPHISSTNEPRYPPAEHYSKEPEDDLDRSRYEAQQPASATLFLPSTISIETAGGISTPIFYKGDTLPSQGHNIFSTASDNQSQVEVHLVLGENKSASDNKSVGKFVLDEIASAPKGVPQIEILYEISQELELNVTAMDRTSGRKKNFRSVDLKIIEPPAIKDPLPPKPSSDFEDLFGGSSDGFSDFFRSIFGKQDAEIASAPHKNDYLPVELSIEEAYKGATRKFQVDGKEKLVRIPAGVRTGTKVRVPGAGPNGIDLYLTVSIQPHPFFRRNGSDLFMEFPITENLAKRGGELRVPLVEKSKSMLVLIPPNTKDNQTIRFAKKGFPNVKNPTEFGDFYLTVALYDPRKIPPETKKLLDQINKYMK